MPVYGVLVKERCNTYRWVLDDFLSLQYGVWSPTFVFENVPFRLKVDICPKEDRLQLSIETEITSDEYFQVTFEMGTGLGERTETRSGRMNRGYFVIRRWMPWSEMLSRRLEILRNGCLNVMIKLQKEEKAFTQANLSPELLETDAERTTEGQNFFDCAEEHNASHYEMDNGSADKNKVASAEDSDDEESEVLLKNFKELRKDLKSLLRTGENSDVTVIVGEREFPAHKCILGMRSPVLKSTFKHDTLEKKTGRLNIEDCDPHTFEDFLYHLYTGSTSRVHSRNASSLYHISNKYKLDELKEVCLSCMKENLTCDTFCDTMSLALLYDEKELFHLATEFFCDNAQKIIKTVEWQVFLKQNPTEGNELFIKYTNAKRQR